MNFFVLDVFSYPGVPFFMEIFAFGLSFSQIAIFTPCDSTFGQNVHSGHLSLNIHFKDGQLYLQVIVGALSNINQYYVKFCKL